MILSAVLNAFDKYIDIRFLRRGVCAGLGDHPY